MKIFPALFRRWQTLNLPLTCLLALLQRTPVVRVAIVAEEFVLSSPVGSVLKSAVAALGALGAVHTLAGATQFVVSPSTNVTGTVGKPLNVAFTITGSPTAPSTFTVGELPPGLVTSPASIGGVVNSGSPAIVGTPTKAGRYAVSVSGTDGTFSLGTVINFNIAEGTAAATAPTFTTQPTSQTVNVRETVVFNVEATGSPAPALQWRKNGAAISGATSGTLSLSPVQSSDAGSYTCVATNSAGTATSNTATLTVNAVVTNTAPAFTTQPSSKTVSTGSTAVFAVAASGTPGPTFQWRKDGAALANATGATLIVSPATAANAGAYTCVATNSLGTATSTAATLAVSATADFGRIINLSILTDLSSSEGLFTVGVSIGGAGTSGQKPLVIRAGGPALATLGVGGVLPDPKLELFSGQTVIAANDNWSTSLSGAFTAVGAFPFAANSKDAAVAPTLAAGGYTVQVKDAATASGTVIAELYDATPAANFTTTTPRLINVSVLKQINAGSILTVGFVLGGSTAKTLLVRVVGPTLAAFGVGGTMADPKLELFSGQTVIAANDNWGGDVPLATAAASVGAFAFASATSKDAMLLITLAPGAYTVQASGVAGSSGSALIEVYDVP